MQSTVITEIAAQVVELGTDDAGHFISVVIGEDDPRAHKHSRHGEPIRLPLQSQEHVRLFADSLYQPVRIQILRPVKPKDGG